MSKKSLDKSIQKKVSLLTTIILTLISYGVGIIIAFVITLIRQEPLILIDILELGIPFTIVYMIRIIYKYVKSLFDLQQIIEEDD